MRKHLIYLEHPPPALTLRLCCDCCGQIGSPEIVGLERSKRAAMADLDVRPNWLRRCCPCGECTSYDYTPIFTKHTCDHPMVHHSIIRDGGSSAVGDTELSSPISSAQLAAPAAVSVPAAAAPTAASLGAAASRSDTSLAKAASITAEAWEAAVRNAEADGPATWEAAEQSAASSSAASGVVAAAAKVVKEGAQAMSFEALAAEKNEALKLIFNSTVTPQNQWSKLTPRGQWSKLTLGSLPSFGSWQNPIVWGNPITEKWITAEQCSEHGSDDGSSERDDIEEDAISEEDAASTAEPLHTVEAMVDTANGQLHARTWTMESDVDEHLISLAEDQAWKEVHEVAGAACKEALSKRQEAATQNASSLPVSSRVSASSIPVSSKVATAIVTPAGTDVGEHIDLAFSFTCAAHNKHLPDCLTLWQASK